MDDAGAGVRVLPHDWPHPARPAARRQGQSAGADEAGRASAHPPGQHQRQVSALPRCCALNSILDPILSCWMYCCYTVPPHALVGHEHKWLLVSWGEKLGADGGGSSTAVRNIVACAVVTCRLRIERTEEYDDEDQPSAPEHAALIFFDEITRGDSSLCEPPPLPPCLIHSCISINCI